MDEGKHFAFRGIPSQNQYSSFVSPWQVFLMDSVPKGFVVAGRETPENGYGYGVETFSYWTVPCFGEEIKRQVKFSAKKNTSDPKVIGLKDGHGELGLFSDRLGGRISSLWRWGPVPMKRRGSVSLSTTPSAWRCAAPRMTVCMSMHIETSTRRVRVPGPLNPNGLPGCCQEDTIPGGMKLRLFLSCDSSPQGTTKWCRRTMWIQIRKNGSSPFVRQVAAVVPLTATTSLKIFLHSPGCHGFKHRSVAAEKKAKKRPGLSGQQRYGVAMQWPWRTVATVPIKLEKYILTMAEFTQQSVHAVTGVFRFNLDRQFGRLKLNAFGVLDKCHYEYHVREIRKLTKKSENWHGLSATNRCDGTIMPGNWC